MLNDKQKRFCEEYVVDMNATQAAIRSGYSEKTAQEQGARLLSNVMVSAEIRKLQQALSESTNITAEMVVNELAKIGFSNLQDYLTEGNNFKDILKVDRDKAASLESIKVTETEWEGGSKTTVQFKLHSKVAALEKLGQHLGIFEKDNNQKNKKLVFKVTNKR